MSSRRNRFHKKKQKPQQNRQQQQIQTPRPSPSVTPPTAPVIQMSGDFDLSYARAATITTKTFRTIEIYLVGCGGTGSFLALHLSRIAKTLVEHGIGTHVFFVDPDTVEDKNIGRQHFCFAEIGLSKSETLSRRYGHAFGINTSAFKEKFNEDMFYRRADLALMVGCVDNAEARNEINETLQTNEELFGEELPMVWYLDCGNGRESGQVTLGSSLTLAELEGSFPDSHICHVLPSPMIQHPELLTPRPEELSVTNMSCAEMMLANLQSLNLNAAIAVQAAEMITQLLITKDLTRHSIEINLKAGSTKAYYTTPEEISRITRKPVDFLRANLDNLINQEAMRAMV